MIESFRVVHREADRAACDPLGIYAETYWLPLLCPTAYVLGRRLVILMRRHHDEQRPGVLMLTPERLAGALSIGRPPGHLDQPISYSLFWRSMKRLERFRLIRWQSEAVLQVRGQWHRPSPAALSKLPPEMQVVEPEFWERYGSPAPVAAGTLSL